MSFDHGATYDFCRVTLAFTPEAVDGTDIAGRKVVLIADTPKVMTDGNWRVGVFVDEDASEEQFGWFLGVWVVMMAAMMFPSVAPTVALYARMTQRRSPAAPLVVHRRLPR